MSLVKGPSLDDDLDILSRPGGNDRVIGKKVLLAKLAGEEVERLGIPPTEDQVQEVADAFLGEIGLSDRNSALAWLKREELTLDEFYRVMTDFAAVLAVEAHYKVLLGEPVDLHRRLIAARSRQLSRQNMRA